MVVDFRGAEAGASRYVDLLRTFVMLLVPRNWEHVHGISRCDMRDFGATLHGRGIAARYRSLRVSGAGAGALCLDVPGRERSLCAMRLPSLGSLLEFSLHRGENALRAC
jgi:hypothetical protein